MKLRTPLAVQANSLDEIFAEEDTLNLLTDLSAKKPKTACQNTPAVTNFLELVAFVEANGHEPRMDISAEKMLAVRLRTYRNRADLRDKVAIYDTVGLLTQVPLVPENPPAEEKEPEPPQRMVSSLDDIFEDDDLDLLGDIDTAIYTLKHVPQQKEKDAPDEIASRKPCLDFFRYEKLFQDIQKILKTDAVMLTRFSKEETVVIGNIFILRGILCYIDSIIKADNSDSDRENPRLRIIFENGTETDLLKRSFMRALFKDAHGRYVDFGLNLFATKSVSITNKDRPTGYVYILSSETESPMLCHLKKAGLLVKIGYSTQEVHERIRNAVNEPTYLEAPVKVKATIACYNLNPQKFENLVHAFLSSQRINMTLTGKDGKSYHPEEWFSVDWQTALAVCQHIVDGTITQYRMDNTTGRMVRCRKVMDINDIQA